MIAELRVKDFGGIEGELLFDSGFNAIIGETGAGKSLLVNSVNFLQGEKMGSLAREGTFVEAVFICDGEEEITARRQIASQRSRFFLNGMRVPKERLKEVVAPLVLFQSQRLHVKLLKPSRQLEVVDRLAGNEKLLSEYKNLYERFKRLSAEVEKIRRELSQKERELAILEMEIEEIESANLKEGEEEELLELKERVAAANEIREAKEKSLYLLEEGEPSALSLIAESSRLFENLPVYSEIARKLDEVYINLREIVSEIEGRVEAPSEEISLEEIEDRLYQIERIKRKYGPTLEEVNLYLVKAKERKALLEGGEELLSEKEEELKKIREELLRAGRELSRRRREGAKELERLMEEEFKELGLEGAKFKVEFKPTDEPKSYGLEEVLFLFSGNPKMELAPLSSSISGGELSRFLLSVLKILSPTQSALIFDEIDAGMSGKTLRKVARKLKEISRRHQVIAVTHSPQLVAAADKVFKVEKLSSGKVVVRELTRREIEEELSVMITGKLTEGALQAAKDLLKSWEEKWDTELLPDMRE